MAIAGTVVARNNNTVVIDVTALDADTGPTNIAHGLSQAPTELVQTNLVSVALAAMGNWSVTADATNLAVVKLGTAGSGGTAPGTTKVLRIIAKVVPSQV